MKKANSVDIKRTMKLKSPVKANFSFSRLFFLVLLPLNISSFSDYEYFAPFSLTIDRKLYVGYMIWIRNCHLHPPYFCVDLVVAFCSISRFIVDYRKLIPATLQKRCHSIEQKKTEDSPTHTHTQCVVYNVNLIPSFIQF